MTDLLLYPRDHNWVNSNAGTTHGAYALHAPSMRDPGLAACSSRIALQSLPSEDAGETVAQAGPRACLRAGCQAAIRRAGAPKPRPRSAPSGCCGNMHSARCPDCPLNGARHA